MNDQANTLESRVAKNEWPFLQTKQISLRSGSGAVKGTAVLIHWTAPVLRTSHNGDTKFKYQTGTDVNGVRYETKSHGGGWRVVTDRRA